MEIDQLLSDFKKYDQDAYDEFQLLAALCTDEKAGIDKNIELDILEGCVRRAIDKKKWYWRITKVGLYSPFDGLLIDLVGYEACVGELIDDDVTASISEKESAYALLSAYIETVREISSRKHN